ncbi:MULTISPECIES: hypothetical protein [Fischerella]|uniref:hypothetical protein n=1 Tax=Fischerella TaxID=1190 RepID=UPI0003772456|nr:MULTISPECIES: hypothetical protein [Fischerella]
MVKGKGRGGAGSPPVGEQGAPWQKGFPTNSRFGERICGAPAEGRRTNTNTSSYPSLN